MSYNGWKNYETWNVALWIGNEEPLYRDAVRFMRDYKGRSPYSDFVSRFSQKATPDGIPWLSRKVSLREMNGFMRELKGEGK